MEANERGTRTSTNGQEPSPQETLNRLLKQLNELSAYFSYFLAAKMDGVKLSVRNGAIGAALGIVGLIALGSVIATAVVLLLTGLAVGLGILLDGHFWLANIVVGGGVLILLGLGIYLGVRRVKKNSLRRTVHSYEQRQREQESKFGRNVSDQAVANEL